MTSQRYCYLVTIEGIGDATGQIRYCWPEKPDYSTAWSYYVAGLAEVPQSTTGTWDLLANELSCGTYTLVLHRGVGPVVWHATEPRSIGVVREDLDASEVEIDLNATCTALGISVGDVLYLDRETILVTVAGAVTHLHCTRGYAGSTAQTHPYGTDLYRYPPALTGRLVTVYRAPHTGGVVGDEVAVSYGYIAGELASGIHDVVLEVQDRFVDGVLGRGDWTSEPYHYTQSGGRVIVDASGMPPFGCPTGGYWRLDPAGVVLAAEWNSGDAVWEPIDITATSSLTWPSTLPSEIVSQGWNSTEAGDRRATQILLSDAGKKFPSFRRQIISLGTWSYRDDPCTIALNLLLSLDGTNTIAGDAYLYDLGAAGTAGGLYPDFSMGIPRAMVNVKAFEVAMFGDLAGIRAPYLWIEAGTGVELREILWRLFLPLGYVCGTGRDGRWTLLKLQDAYPSWSVVTVDALIRPADTQTTVVARALDRVTLGIEATPDGEAGSTVIVDEGTGRRWYPPHVGDRQEWSPLPYRFADYDAEGPLYRRVAQWIRRLASRLTCISCFLGPDYYDLVDLGTVLAIGDKAICDPRTGDRATTAYPVYVMVTEITADWMTRTLRITGYVLDRTRLGLVSPSAKIAAWDAGTKTATVALSQYSPGYQYTHGVATGDAGFFAGGDKVVLLNSHLVPRSATTGVNVAVIDTVVDSTHIRIAGAGFHTGGGLVVTPVATDIIVYADYNDLVANQWLTYASCAVGGDPASGLPYLDGGADPYVIGD